MKAKHMIHSFSRIGNPYDNTCIESFHPLLKKDEINHQRYQDYNTAQRAVLNILNLGTIGKEFIVQLII